MKKDNNARIKLIVVDLDGTLLSNHKQIDPGMRDVVHALKERHIQVTFASGRNVHIITPFFEEMPIEVPYIANNGANIFLKEHCIYEECMEMEELIIAFRFLKEKGISYIAYTRDAVYIEKETAPMQFFLDRLRGKTQICREPDVREIAAHKIFKVVVLPEEHAVMAQLMEQMNTTCTHLQCVRSEDAIYTMTHIEATKGKALERVLALLSIKAEEVMVFGDNFNDLSMFAVAGTSIAMENGQDEVKKQADFITKSNEECGVSSFLRSYFNL